MTKYDNASGSLVLDVNIKASISDAVKVLEKNDGKLNILVNK